MIIFSPRLKNYQFSQSRCISFYIWQHYIHILYFSFNPFPNKPWFLRVCSTSLLKTLWEKEKLLVTSNFSFSHNVFYPFIELSAIFIPFEIVVCKLFQFGKVHWIDWMVFYATFNSISIISRRLCKVQNLSFGKGLIIHKHVFYDVMQCKNIN